MFGFGAPPWVWAVGAAAVAAAALLWPLRVGFSVQIDVLERDLKASATSAWGRIGLKTVHGEGGRLKAVLEVRALHLWPLRLTAAVGGGIGPSGRDDDSPDKEPDLSFEDRNLFGFVREVWDRWRAGAAALGRAGRRLLPRMRLHRLHVRGRIGLGDAARTAVFCGVLWSFYGAIAGWLQRGSGPGAAPRLHIVPVYNRWQVQTQAEGVFTVRLLDLALAAWAGLATYRRKQPPAPRPVARPQNV